MDRADLEDYRAKEIVSELNNLIKELQSRQLKISSWFGKFDLSGDKFEHIMRGYNYEPLKLSADDSNFPWFKYWEIVWLTTNNDFQPDTRILDLGGSSSLFSYYLASKGLDVTTIDIQETLNRNGNNVARKMRWKLKCLTMDMRKMFFKDKFENVTSVCVFEHLSKVDRIRTISTIRDLLSDGGRFSITFDFGISHINTSRDVHDQFIKYSALHVRGNQTFVDNGKRYLLHPFYYRPWSWKAKTHYIMHGYCKPWELLRTKSTNDFTFGALFQEKEK
ncbi:MAG: class I SAM-dependent methyltransferase [Candidatus Bathyarchaeota archaeon]|nr:class I SAM-dependent methyltransferase [Candidatus Bathyarchaeota archaeon]